MRQSGSGNGNRNRKTDDYINGEGTTWFAFMESLVERKMELGKAGTARAYANTLQSLRRFRKGADFPTALLTQDLVEDYEAWLLGRGLCRNTTSMYMRCLRAVYNRAVKSGKVPAAEPFRQVYTGIDRTVKRALPLPAIRKIKNLELPRHSSLAMARHLFMFSFYARGMAFVDMAYLKRSDLQGRYLSYVRQKTRKRMTVCWEPCMEEIVERVGAACTSTPYLLPIILREDGTERRQYENALHLVNHRLKTVGEPAGLSTPLSMHVARHSWATIAHSKHIPLAVISDALGHDCETTTLIYLSLLSTDAVDQANRSILEDL